MIYLIYIYIYIPFVMDRYIPILLCFLMAIDVEKSSWDNSKKSAPLGCDSMAAQGRPSPSQTLLGHSDCMDVNDLFRNIIHIYTYINTYIYIYIYICIYYDIVCMYLCMDVNI